MKLQRLSTLALAAAACLPGALTVLAQEPDPAEAPSSGWRKFGDSSRSPAASAPLPPQLVLPAGAFVTVSVDQQLSSDRNFPGDVFSATLVQPVVVNGYVVARRGQTLSGRVAEAQKAGRVQGQSRLGIELTELSLVDGQQLPIATQLIEYSGGTSHGRDATAIAATTGTGAAIGAAAAGGFGAGVGAAAGAMAATIGVLATRGHATEVYPEARLTFRTMQPLTIDTERSEMAFHPVTQADYETRRVERRPTLQGPRPGGYYAGWGYPYPAPFFYSPFYYGYGPSFYFYSGPRFYRGRR